MNKRVAIVGASVAGLHAARRLARAGLNVTVIEQAAAIRPPRRSLIVTARYRDYLGPVGEAAITNEIHAFDLVAGERRASVPLQSPDLIIERQVLIGDLAESAASAGVRVMTGIKVDSLHADDDGLQLGFARGAESIRADIVIGADGAHSTVARLAGWPKIDLVPLVQVLVRRPQSFPLDRSTVWFVPGETPYFYWLIPDGDETAGLGVIGVEDGRSTRERLDGFARRQGFETLGYQGARIPEYRCWIPIHRRLPGGDVYLAGDAAAQVKVTTVGGIVDGVWGADAVVDRIVGTGRSTERALRVELELHRLIRRGLHHFSEADYETLLASLDRGSRQTLATYSRDETFRLLRHLLVASPRLALLGARGLLSSTRQRPGRDSVGLRPRAARIPPDVA